MALTVMTLFNHLGIYRLRLVAGRNGLENQVSWVYYTEDPETIAYLRGGELAITTCLNIERHRQNTGDGSSNYQVEFLEKLISEFVKRNASGLIVNTGKYIETIPQEIIDLCDRLNFPLFTMPWEIHTIDVMQDVGNRISSDNQKRRSLEQCFYDAIFHKNNFDESQLENTVFAKTSDYSIVLVSISESLEKEDEEKLKRYVEFSFNTKLDIKTCDYSWFIHDSEIIYIFNADGLSFARNIQKISATDKHFSASKIGVSLVCHSAKDLDIEYEHAKTALEFCSEDMRLQSYCDLGIYKIFAEVKDPLVLEMMYDEVLGNLNEYNPTKKENYLETLKLYIESSGKIQKTAEENSTHRNTINYRIHKISEILGVDLQNGETRYLIQTALYIKDYLNRIESQKKNA